VCDLASLKLREGERKKVEQRTIADKQKEIK
jgi:predicted DNA-binding antitoxin AbrB/MazE fold protein